MIYRTVEGGDRIEKKMLGNGAIQFLLIYRKGP